MLLLGLKIWKKEKEMETLQNIDTGKDFLKQIPITEEIIPQTDK